MKALAWWQEPARATRFFYSLLIDNAVKYLAKGMDIWIPSPSFSYTECILATSPRNNSSIGQSDIVDSLVRYCVKVDLHEGSKI